MESLDNLESVFRAAQNDADFFRTLRDLSLSFSCRIRGEFPESANSVEVIASRVRGLLSDALSGRTEADAVALVRAMGEFGGKGDIDLLMGQLVSDRREVVRWAIINAIRSIGGVYAVKSLNAVATSDLLSQGVKDFALVSSAEARTNDRYDGSFGPWAVVDRSRSLFRTSQAGFHSFNSWAEFRSELLSGGGATETRLEEIFALLDES